MKILLADDNQDIVHLARRKLENEGYDVFSITNGAEALDIVKSTDIDIMVLNINLPYLRWNKINKTMKEKTDSPVIFILPENLEGKLFRQGRISTISRNPFTLMNSTAASGWLFKSRSCILH